MIKSRILSVENYSGISEWTLNRVAYVLISRKVKCENVSCSVVSISVQPHMAQQAPPSMGFPRQEYWSGLPFPSPGDLPNPGTEPGSPAFWADSLLSEPPGKSIIRGRQMEI